MKKFVLLWLCFLLFVTGCGNIKKTKTTEDKVAYEVIDAQGLKIGFTHKPQRIITDSLGLDEIVLGIVPGEKLAAVNYLDSDRAISFIVNETKNVEPKLKNYSSEEIAALQPDLFIASTWTDKEKLQTLRRLGIPVVVCKGPATIKDVQDTVRLVAAALGEAGRGKLVNEKMNKELTKIDSVIKAQKQAKPVVMLVSLMSSYGGRGSLYDVLCQQAGLVNGIAKAGLKNGEFLAKELVIKVNPELFILSAPSRGDSILYEKYRKKFMSDKALAGLTGINHVVVIPDRYLYCSSQNIIYGIKTLANKGYGQVLFPLGQENCLKGY
jgi:iron complex transport system substrate-binding protein